MPLGGVFVLLCTTPPKVHPAQVISVLYPVAGGETTGSAGDGGSGLVAWRRWRQERVKFHDTDDVIGTERCQCVCVFVCLVLI